MFRMIKNNKSIPFLLIFKINIILVLILISESPVYGEDQKQTLIQQMTQSVINYADSSAKGLDAVIAIVLNDFPHFCDQDNYFDISKQDEDIRYGGRCDENDLLQMLPHVKIDKKVYQKLKKQNLNQDKWTWLKKVLKEELTKLECDKKYYESFGKDLESKKTLFENFHSLVKIKKQLKNLESNLYNQFKKNTFMMSYVNQYNWQATCLPTGNHALDILKWECPESHDVNYMSSDLGDMGKGLGQKINAKVTDAVFGGFSGPLFCEKALSQSKFKELPLSQKVQNWGDEKFEGLIRKCMVQRFTLGDLTQLKNYATSQGKISPDFQKEMNKYYQLKSLENNLIETNPLLRSSQMRTAIGLASYSELSEDSVKDKFKNSYERSLKNQLKTINEQRRKFNKIINSDSKEIPHHLTDSELLSIASRHFPSSDLVKTPLDRTISCEMYLDYIRDEGLMQLKKDILNMIVMSMPTLAGGVLKLLKAEKEMAVVVETMNLFGKTNATKTVASSKISTSMATLVLSEGTSLGYDLSQVAESADRCHNVTKKFLSSRTCYQGDPSYQSVKKEYDDCRSTLSETIGMTIIAASTGAFFLGSEIKSLQKEEKGLSQIHNRRIHTVERREQNRSLRQQLSELEQALGGSKEVERIYSEFKNSLSLEFNQNRDKIYFAGLVDLVRKDVKNALKADGATISKELEDKKVLEELSGLLKKCPRGE